MTREIAVSGLEGTPDQQAIEDARLIWEYHQMRHDIRPASVGIGLGSHDLGVATSAAELYGRGLFPELVFTGANSPTTVRRFPRGEAIHYRDHAVELGVPASAVWVEPTATNTGQNLALTRKLLASKGKRIESVLLSDSSVRVSPVGSCAESSGSRGVGEDGRF